MIGNCLTERQLREHKASFATASEQWHAILIKTYFFYKLSYIKLEIYHAVDTLVNLHKIG